MKIPIMIMVMVAGLAACAPLGSPQADSRAVVAQGCEAYADALMAAAHARDAGDLAPEAIEAVNVVRWSVGPICEDQGAYDPILVAETVRNGVRQLILLKLEARE